MIRSDGRLRSRRPGESILGQVAAIEKGFGVKKLQSMSSRTGIGEDVIRSLVRIPTATYARRKKSGTFTADESDRLYRLEYITNKTIAFFDGDSAIARHWLDKPASALDGLRPLDLLINEAGVREVENLLGRLEHGVFT